MRKFILLVYLPLLRLLVSDFSPQGPRFNLTGVYVEYVGDKVVLQQFLLLSHWFFLARNRSSSAQYLSSGVGIVGLFEVIFLRESVPPHQYNCCCA
jgi:hypothetical protein